MKDILEKILNVSNNELNLLNTGFINRYNFFHDTSYFHLESGKEHYRLLMYISSLFNKEILFDIGTHKCMSAAALSYSMKNRIKTYDIKQYIVINPLLAGVGYNIGNATKDKDLEKSPFIFFDAAHDGVFENIFYNHLKNINWKGLLLLDDINECSNEMTEFWNSIKDEKYDISHIGHWSGTGLVYIK